MSSWSKTPRNAIYFQSIAQEAETKVVFESKPNEPNETKATTNWVLRREEDNLGGLKSNGGDVEGQHDNKIKKEMKASVYFWL